ncbi:hypothetical protein HYH02_011047 [Chlamydomonas schloesseri]|uniref:RRM domain-containing protein n=1 Tax=Chlamydomonas schloesseri TaxID=2026947 RepID=A0A835W213_9CHLO|nr:hypothetical protein HYH02_011047 [Chlamydomonas schloesseri]|eukprot:KAG2437667.1 hypothetical protein HYH02_011047 [Chlamydomonas schloesseri]
MADQRERSRERSPEEDRAQLDSPRGEDDRRRVSSRERGERGTSREYRDRSRDRDGERERGRDSRDRDTADRRDHRDYERERGRGERDWDLDRRGDRYDDRRRRSRSRDRDYRRRSRSRSRGRYDYSPPRRRDDREWRGGGGRGGRRGGRYEDSEEEAQYGGYRPRRRQDPHKSDKPLPPGAGPGAVQDPFYYLRQNVPTDPAEAQRLWLEQQLKSRQMVLQQQAVSAAAASAKTQRELYIGNLVPGAVTDVALRQLFNATLLAAFPPTAPGEPDPVSNVNLHSEGRYAFVEFRSPEMATAALALNNQVQLLGQTISVGRPSGYVDPSKAATAATAAAAALEAFQKGDMEQLAQHAAAAGMNLAQLGLATLMLQAKSGAAAAAAAAGGAAAAAAAAAPGAGAQLPLPPPPPLPGSGNGAAAVAAVAAAIGHGPSEAEAGAGAAAAGGAGGGGELTSFLEVDGMLSEDLLVDDEEYESESYAAARHTVRAPAPAPPSVGAPPCHDAARPGASAATHTERDQTRAAGCSAECNVMGGGPDQTRPGLRLARVIEDLRDECDRHTPGGVLGVKVPRPPPEQRGAGGFMGSGHFGKAFVSFRDCLAAQRAHAAIHGRLFAGNTVRAAHISAEQFAAVPDN